MTATDSIYAIRQLRRTIVMGLAAVAELDRLEDAYEKAGTGMPRGHIPDDLRPITSGMVGDFAEFAEALAMLDIFERDVDDGKLRLP